MSQPWPVVDLFSGAGGMSCGFSRHAGFELIGAADAQLGKPSAVRRLARLQRHLRGQYRADAGRGRPCQRDAGRGLPRDGHRARHASAVLTACPPCTGFSRTIASNHLRDDHRNGLVRRVGEYAALLRPDIVLVENARELVTGRFSGHLRALLRTSWRGLGYRASADTHFLTEFGPPQRRERAIVVAVRRPLPLRGLR